MGRVKTNSEPSTRPGRDRPYAERRADWAARPVRLTTKGPGVTLVVLRELRRATAANPVDKVYLLGVLEVEFPDRDPKKMMTNLNNLVPGRLREHYGIHVWRTRGPSGRMAYWLPPENKPQHPERKKGSK